MNLPNMKGFVLVKLNDAATLQCFLSEILRENSESQVSQYEGEHHAGGLNRKCRQEENALFLEPEIDLFACAGAVSHGNDRLGG